MELARDGNESQARNSNRRCAGITGSRRESRSAVTRNGRMPACTFRDAGVFERTANSCPCLADAARCGALQQARTNRGGWRLISHDVLIIFWGNSLVKQAFIICLLCGDIRFSTHELLAPPCTGNVGVTCSVYLKKIL